MTMNTWHVFSLLFLSAGFCCTVGQAEPTMPLDGPWAFRLDPANQGISENWQQATLPDTITLPGSTDEAGYGTENAERRVAYLSRLWEYTGPAWYQREVVIPERWAGKHVTLFLERAHWETQVWVDDAKAGMCDSLCVPHIYDLSALLTPGPHRLTLRVDNTIKYKVGINAHSITEHTQTNWNGIVGRIELRAQDPVHVKSVAVFPNVSKHEAKLLVTIRNATESAASGTIECEARLQVKDPQDASEADAEIPFAAPPGQETSVELILVLGDGVRLWDEFSPALYELAVTVAGEANGQSFEDTQTTRFGMREMGQVGTHVAINGRPIMIRGTLECCIFPLTGYPATDVAAWKRMYDIARSYGLNHFRFHSWCPPEAAFDAADEAGFTLHVETPVWTELGSDTNTDLFIHEEANRILAAYGNHPSFCMMAVGNEPSGPKKGEFLREIVWEWKQKDPRRLYTTCAGWPELPLSNYHVVHQRWDKPYRLHGGPLRPDTMVDYFEVIKDAPVPVIAHELGQWCVYPSYEEIPKYTGALRARNLEVFRESLDAHHMLDQAQTFSQASGALQTLMYKADIEAILRTPGTGGYQLLQLQDFPGQGSALMGFLDAFWDSKGYCTPEQFREFSSETVPLLRLEKFIWTNGETLTAKTEISHFGPAPLTQASPTWTITSDGKQVASGRLPQLDIPLGNGTPLGEFHVDLSAFTSPAKYTVTLALEGTPWRNHWDLWVYPAVVDTAPPADVLIANEWTPEVADVLEKGGKVLLLPGYLAPGCSVSSAFEPVFWNMQWFPGQRRQLGILCDPAHPAFAQFPTDRHTNWQWWDLLNKSRAMNLDSFPPDFRPFLQVIDDWNTNRRLGFAFEARVANGKLLVCSLDVADGLDQRLAARQLRHSLLAYLAGDQFSPAATLEPAAVEALFLRPDVEVARVDSEATGYEGVKAIDGDPATAWHTPWGAGSPGFPHEIQLRLKTERPVAGLRYLPRQDVANGYIAKYEVYVSSDGQDWGQPVAKGKFEKGPAEQLVRFEKPVTGRYVRLVALSDFAGDPFLAVAELEVLGKL